MLFSKIIFWVSFITILYTYLGYPIILFVLSIFYGRKPQVITEIKLSVSMILTVYNEMDIIQQKIENFNSIDYPEEKLELIIVSDCSNDRTDEIIGAYVNYRITLVRQNKRKGKTAALNLALHFAKGEILVFTDANSMFNKNALKILIGHFHDSKIGLVSGRTKYIVSKGHPYDIYTMTENYIKSLETKVESIVGADGGIYALRKVLYEELKPEYINDLIHPIQIVLKGYRGISESGAISKEVFDKSHKKELNRQVRIMAQSWLIFYSQIVNLVKKRAFLYAWEIISHKLLRWITLPIFLLLFLSSILNFNNGILFQAITLLNILFLFLASWAKMFRGTFMLFPLLFFITNVGAMLGLFYLLLGKKYVIWTPRDS